MCRYCQSKGVFPPTFYGGLSDKTKQSPEIALIFHRSQGRYLRPIKYSYQGSSHLRKIEKKFCCSKKAGKAGEGVCKEKTVRKEPGKEASVMLCRCPTFYLRPLK